MEIENLDTSSTANDNQNAPASTDEIIDKAAETQPAPIKKPSPATSVATDKPEFTDPNMQSRFTQRMTEFSEKEKALNDKIKRYEGKYNAFQNLEKDQGAVKILREYYENKKSGATPAVAELTQEQFLDVTTDPKKFQEYVANQAKILAKQMLDKELASTREDVKTLKESDATNKLSQDIDNFASSKGKDGQPLYPDFYDLSEKIIVYLEHFQTVPNLSNEQKLEMAYKLVKFPNAKKEVVAAAHKLVDTKKKATGDKGGVGSSSFSRTKKAVDIETAIAEAADQLTW